MTSGIDVALHLVERTLGPRVAHAIETLFEHERRVTVWRNQGIDPGSFERNNPSGDTRPEQPPAVISAVPSGVVGVWDVVIATPMGKQVVAYYIAAADGGLMSTATQGGEASPLLNPAADGGRLTWTQHVTKPMRLTLRFDVMVDGAAMTAPGRES